MTEHRVSEYHETDFTEDEYRLLIKTAKAKYSFGDFSSIKDKKSFILWRHDVDYSVHRALRLAQIENEEGVKSTYFLLLNCEFYNLFEISIKKIVKEIISLGHEIGLHFDLTAYKINEIDELDRFLSFEKSVLENLFEVNVQAFSFHNPTLSTLKVDDFKLAGMVNAYAPLFKEEFGYCSDSNGYWRHSRLMDVLKNGQYDKLQVLTHPAWWQKEVMLPRQRIERCISGRAAAVGKAYDDLLEQNNRENIG